MAPSTLPLLTARLRSAGCVFAEEEAALILATARTAAERTAMTEQRSAGLPLEHVLGWAEFCGLRLHLAPGVFVPRPRTALLARRAAALLTPASVAVDLCCGSGALGAVLARTHPGLTLHAADIDPASVACARRNLPAHHVHRGDLYDALPATLRGRVHVLVANVPYVPTDQIPLLPAEARLHEHPRALDGGTDGLDLVRRLAAHATDWLTPGGHLLTEVNPRQLPAAEDALTRGGLTCTTHTSPDQDTAVLTGTRPASTLR
ncbi:MULTISPECIES: putative protein N(5)-glutamine methyltransferase [unclassified Nocardiopsis]|uniref:putative protein N(5)-glutamine methyltransferase n=1 Tax=unclassified Nocardiopsis TaxID=2649073 RepID=UPI001F19E377|nr:MULTISPECIES: putative protein N(5)-glutamine methyltransferase [unclassified Nocardiopsis]